MFKFQKASDIEKLLSALESSASFYSFLDRSCENPFLAKIYEDAVELRHSAGRSLQDYLFQDAVNAVLRVDEHRIQRLRESYLLVMRMYTGDDIGRFAKELIYTEKLLISLFASNLLVSRRSDLTVTLASIAKANRHFQLRIEAITTASI